MMDTTDKNSDIFHLACQINSMIFELQDSMSSFRNGDKEKAIEKLDRVDQDINAWLECLTEYECNSHPQRATKLTEKLRDAQSLITWVSKRAQQHNSS